MSLRWWLVGLLLLLTPLTTQAAMVHPGVINTADEYDVMRQKVAAGTNPWKAAYEAIPASVCTVASTMPSSMHITLSEPTPAYPLRTNAIRAYGAALRWVIGGSTVCRDNAIQLLNSMKVLTSITGDAQRNLNVSWYLPTAIYAAEILKHLPGSTWSVADQNAWRAWVEAELDQFFQGTNCPRSFTGSCNNWAAYGLNVRAAWAVYTDNPTLLAAVKADYQELVTYYISRFGKPWIFDGFTEETCRLGNSHNGGLQGSDLWHTGMAFIGMMATAEIFKQQGDVSVYNFVGADDGFGLRTGLLGHSPFYYWPQRNGSSNATWPCQLPIDDTPLVSWMAAYNHYRDPIMLTLSNYAPNPPIIGSPNDYMNIPFDRLTHNYFGLVSEEPTEPPPPLTPQTWYAATTGTGSACTQAAPCSIAEVMTKHVGGDTIKLGNSVYPYECHGCLKSGTAGQHTILESLNYSAAITIGTDGLSVTPGLATLSGNTGITLWIKPGQQHITVRGVNCTTTGPGTNPCVQVSDQSATSSNAATDLLFENMDIQAPTRVGATAAALQRGTNGSARVTWDRVRIHHAGAPVNFDQTNPTTNGLRLNGPDHRVLNSDISSNQRHGISARCEGCSTTRVDRLQVTGTRFLGNGLHGLDLGEGADQQVAHNIFTGNGGTSVLVNGTSTRAKVYNNTSYANSQLTTGGSVGMSLAAGVTAVVRNNILANHPLGPIFIGAQASQVSCSHNLTDAASGPAGCSSWTLNAVPTDVWMDPTPATLALRNFALKTTPPSVAINNGTPDICSTGNAGSNLCTPVLTVSGAGSSLPDQGAIESGFTVPVTQALIASYSFDTDFTDSTTFANHGTATSVTIDPVNTRAGTGSAFFNATTDRLTIPINGANISQGLSVALVARVVSLGTQTFFFGMTSNPPGFANRVQISKDATDRLLIGLGGSRLALQTNATFGLNTWHAIVFTMTPGATAGSGTMAVEFDGVPVGSGTYTGLNTLSPATIGNNDGDNIQGMHGQIDELRIWNYPIPATLRSGYCDDFCMEPTPPDEEFLLGAGQIGPSGDNVVSIEIISGADAAKCTPLSDWQVTYGGVAQTETACTITGTTPPMTRITLAANALPGQVVTLTYQDDDPITIHNQVQGQGSFDPLVLVSCMTDVTGLDVRCQAQGNPNPRECQEFDTKFIVRDECVSVPLSNCSLTSGPGGRFLTLRRVSPPVHGTIAIDLIHVPSDTRLGVTNLFNPTDPEIPPLTGLAQTQWRCRVDGLNDSTPWKGRPNQLCRAPSPGGVNLRVAIANTSGAAIPDFATSLFCSRQDAGEDYGSFVRVGSSFGTLGLRFGPQTERGVPDGVLLASAALPVEAGLAYVPIGGFRRQELPSGRPTLGDDEQMEEEYAIQIGPLASHVPLGTRFVCRAHDRLGTALASYTGLPGCTNAPGPYGPGDVPCGAPILITAPERRSR